MNENVLNHIQFLLYTMLQCVSWLDCVANDSIFSFWQSLGCTLYAMCFYESPFDKVHQRGDSIALAAMACKIDIPNNNPWVYQNDCSFLHMISATDLSLLSPAAPKARDVRYCNAPHPSVCLSRLVFAL